MPKQFTGNLKGNQEYIFRQTVMGSIAHLITNPDDYLSIDWNQLEPITRRMLTVCGKDLKYNEKYSVVERREGIVRNACEYCFTEYEPEKERVRKANFVDELPF